VTVTSSEHAAREPVPVAHARPRGSRRLYAFGVLLLLLTSIGVWSIGSRRASQARAEAGAREQELGRGARVRVAPVKPGPAARVLSLQGEARPFAEVTLYAKVSGYLRNLRVDKGDRVRAGQLIATIDSPELDSQFLAAQADAKNKRANAKRYGALGPTGMVSSQELEQAQANADVADATQASLATQRGYRIIRAPFDGLVTARFADPGALIQSAANGQSGAIPIVTVSKADRLRVYVYLDQSSAAFVHNGDLATITTPERPGFSRKAPVARTAGQLAPRTRTMLTEIDVDDADGAIVPGSFVQVTLETRRPPSLEVPAEALVMRNEKPHVAVIDAGHHVHYRQVVIADDDGQSIRLQDGVKAGELVALDLGNAADDGAAVQVIAPPPAPPAPASARR
jgi:RND family efflux transporter MFP subunit